MLPCRHAAAPHAQTLQNRVWRGGCAGGACRRQAAGAGRACRSAKNQRRLRGATAARHAMVCRYCSAGRKRAANSYGMALPRAARGKARGRQRRPQRVRVRLASERQRGGRQKRVIIQKERVPSKERAGANIRQRKKARRCKTRIVPCAGIAAQERKCSIAPSRRENHRSAECPSRLTGRVVQEKWQRKMQVREGSRMRQASAEAGRVTPRQCRTRARR